MDSDLLARKLPKLRLWPSPDGERGWDQDVMQIGGSILCVSQFTLYGRQVVREI